MFHTIFPFHRPHTVMVLLFMVAMNMYLALSTLERYSFRRTIYIGATHEHAKITTLIKLS